MAIPYNGIDPYEVLGISNNVTPLEIKKAYKKLCLKYHPDKIQQQQTQVDTSAFPRIQFSYSILSDPIKRQRYDNTGSLDESEISNDFNWKEYFESMNEKITIDMIEEDKAKYQNSDEEKEDILQNFVYYEGDFLKLFEVIPHLEFNEQEESRVFNIIETELQVPTFRESLDNLALKAWEKYKKSRKTKVRQMLKKLAKEAKEAEELEKILQKKSNAKLNSESDLKLLIQSRQANRLDDLINNLESKYVNKKGKKRISKEINDDEFEKIQSNLVNNKTKKRKY